MASIYTNKSPLEDVMEENMFFMEVIMKKNNITRNKLKKSKRSLCRKP